MSYTVKNDRSSTHRNPGRGASGRQINLTAASIDEPTESRQRGRAGRPINLTAASIDELTESRQR